MQHRERQPRVAPSGWSGLNRLDRRLERQRCVTPQYHGALRITGILLAIAVAAFGQSGPRKLRVAAASDLQFAMTDLAREFRQAHPDIDLDTVFGSSGNFYAEIGNGAPFDFFLSADSEYPRRLIQDKLADPASLFVYGVGHLAVWVSKDSPIDVARLGMKSLAAASVKHIAIANPEHAPYGRAAQAAIRSAGIYDSVAPKLVMGENIAQAFQFVQSGAAEIGIVAMSLALAPSAREKGKFWEVPANLHPKMEQSGVILTHAANPDGARAFRSFLLSDAALRTLKSYGFF
jgi:molybdate transport system substrate-binding protein